MTYLVDPDKFVLVIGNSGCTSVNEAIATYLKISADTFIDQKILTRHLIFVRFVEGKPPVYKILPKTGIDIDSQLKEGWYLYHGTKKPMTYPIPPLNRSISISSSTDLIEWTDESLQNSTDILVDDFTNFVTQCVKPNVNGKIDKTILFNRYVLWCLTSRVLPETPESLELNLQRKGYATSQGGYWHGISFH